MTGKRRREDDSDSEDGGNAAYGYGYGYTYDNDNHHHQQAKVRSPSSTLDTTHLTDFTAHTNMALRPARPSLPATTTTTLPNSSPPALRPAALLPTHRLLRRHGHGHGRRRPRGALTTHISQPILAPRQTQRRAVRSKRYNPPTHAHTPHIQEPERRSTHAQPHQRRRSRRADGAPGTTKRESANGRRRARDGRRRQRGTRGRK
jgi:hypothetical protein